MNKKIILVSHGRLSEGMLDSIKMIIGNNDSISCLKMLPGEHYSVVSDEIKRRAEAEKDTQFIIIGDLLGGSVCNGCAQLVNYSNIKLVTGMNMGLVIELALHPDPLTDEELAEKIEQCKEGIAYISPKSLQSNQDNIDDFF